MGAPPTPGSPPRRPPPERRLSPLLPQAWFARDALDVARELVGHLVQRDEVVLRITETEAYRGAWDTACHARAGLTGRTRWLFGPPGHAYVFLCYGLHQMLNVVTDQEGCGAAVLIRACEVVHGLDHVRERRGGRQGPGLLTGPGKVGAALALDTSWSGHALFAAGGLELREGSPPAAGLLVGPRVGIAFADPAHVAAPWRFAAAGTPWVTARKGLTPLAAGVLAGPGTRGIR